MDFCVDSKKTLPLKKNRYQHDHDWLTGSLRGGIPVPEFKNRKQGVIEGQSHSKIKGNPLLLKIEEKGTKGMRLQPSLFLFFFFLFRLGQNLIDDAVFHRLLGIQVEVAVSVTDNLFHRLAGVLDDDVPD